jgi:MFS family permease
VTLGLRANAGQFALLVLVNAFVGAMVGVERSVLPTLAETRFGVASATVALTFLVAFGLAKALCNLLAGELATRIGRRRLLLLGWLVGIPVPVLLATAPSWEWIVFANLLLGANQGLAWSATILMKIDLVGPRRRGLAMGLNEFAGYLAVGGAALGAGYLAAAYGPESAPFWIAGGALVLGITLTLAFVRDTGAHLALEAREAEVRDQGAKLPGSAFGRLLHSSWTDRQLLATNQAGPMLLAAEGLDAVRIGWIAALYPAVWGVAQIGTGALSDHVGRDPLIVVGMLVQGAALVLVALAHQFGTWAAASVLLGLGTAAVYPTLIARVADRVRPGDRAAAVGIYRLWRDLGYVVGGLTVGFLADAAGFRGAILVVAGATAASGLLAAALLSERPPGRSLTHGAAPVARS